MPKGVYDRSHIKNEFWKYSPRYKQKLNKDPSSGKIMGKTQRWRLPGILGFANWFKDIRPRILSKTGKYERMRLTRDQGEYLKELLKTDPQTDELKYNFGLLIANRQMGKTTLHILIDLWFFMTKENFTIQLLGSTQAHCTEVLFNRTIGIIKNTPELRKRIKPDWFSLHSITSKNKRRGSNRILSMLGQSERSSFGGTINLIHLADAHSLGDWSHFNNLQGSMLSMNGFTLVDSNVGSIDGEVHELQKIAESGEEPGMYCKHIFYHNWEDWKKRAPKWLSRRVAARMRKTLLPSEKKRDLYGQYSDAQSQLFPTRAIEWSKEPYKAPVTDIESIAKGRSYVVGLGLDRSKSIFGDRLSKANDNTILTAVAKISDEYGEPHIHVLEEVNVLPNVSSHLKKQIMRIHKLYNLTNFVLEDVEIQDLLGWLTDEKIPFETVSPHMGHQTMVFGEFYRIVMEERFHFPKQYTKLSSEMRTFTYTQKSANKYTFGHATKKFKDDRVYAAGWSIFSLRKKHMAIFQLGTINCTNKSQHRQHCYLNGGKFVLPGCSQFCEAHSEVVDMYEQFLTFQSETELSLQEFYSMKVKHIGSRILAA